MATTNKMTVEIWSDVMCPFCYIGKRKFESALGQFQEKQFIELVWKSFQLSPDMETDPLKNVHQFLAEHKRMSVEDAKALNNQVSAMAAKVGLQFDLDRSVVANSFNAHRFVHFAKRHNRQDQAEEQLFRAYFTDGKNIDDYPTLIRLGVEIGLPEEPLTEALENGMYDDSVKADISEAHALGIRGVPFFIFNRKVAVSGAQDTSVFLKTLESSFHVWRNENPVTTFDLIEGQTCTPGEECI